MKCAPRPSPRVRSALRAFFAHDGVPVGLIAIALMLGTYALLGLPPSVPLLIASGCGAVGVYQLDRSLGLSPEDRINRPARTRWMQAHRRYVVATIVGAGAVGGLMLPLLRPETVIGGAALGAVGLLHVSPVVRGRRLKAWGTLKPIVVSGVWATGAVLLPVLEAGYPVTAGVGALLGYRFALVLVNTLVADVGDRVGDAQAGLHTWATRWPVSMVLRGAYVVLGGILIGGVGAVGWGGAPPLLLIDLVGALLLGGVVRRVQADRAWAHHMAVDAVIAWPLVPFLVMRVGEHLEGMLIICSPP